MIFNIWWLVPLLHFQYFSFRLAEFSSTAYSPTASIYFCSYAIAPVAFFSFLFEFLMKGAGVVSCFSWSSQICFNYKFLSPHFGVHPFALCTILFLCVSIISVERIHLLHVCFPFFHPFQFLYYYFVFETSWPGFPQSLTSDPIIFKPFIFHCPTVAWARPAFGEAGWAVMDEAPRDCFCLWNRTANRRCFKFSHPLRRWWRQQSRGCQKIPILCRILNAMADVGRLVFISSLKHLFWQIQSFRLFASQGGQNQGRCEGPWAIPAMWASFELRNMLRSLLGPRRRRFARISAACFSNHRGKIQFGPGTELEHGDAMVMPRWWSNPKRN